MTDKQMIERLRLYAEELIEPHDGDMGGARMMAAKIMREAADALSAITPPNGDEVREALEVFERVTRLADTLASHVLITAGARGHIQAAYDALAALAKEKRG